MNKRIILFTSGIIISLIGLILGLSDYIDDKINIAYDTMNNKLATINTKEEQVVEEIEDLEHYIGYLEIPKIDFNRGFYSKNSTLNNVEVNNEIILHKKVDREDVEHLVNYFDKNNIL